MLAMAAEVRPVEPGVSADRQAVFTIPNHRPDAPQLELRAHAHPAGVTVWTNTTSIQFEVVVEDDRFDPVEDCKWLWKGDCL